MSLGLIPLRNFAKLEGNLYRSAQPQYPYEYAWLNQKLGIKHIVNLRAEASIDDHHAPQNGIQVHNLLIADHHAPTDEQGQYFIDLIHGSTDPILFHCEHGRGRTSTFSVLAKLATGWSLADAINDEETSYGYKFIYQEQIAWLKQFYQKLITQPK